MVIWIIGLSGTGKSYLANKIYKNLKYKKKIIVDGDEVRKYITYDLKYTEKDRLKNSKLISDLCLFLEKKGFYVICPILSIFPQHQKRNRKIFKNYFQIQLKSSKKKLVLRNNKNIYSKNNVVGKDIKFPKPFKNNLVIVNNFRSFSKTFIDKVIKKIEVNE